MIHPLLHKPAPQFIRTAHNGTTFNLQDYFNKKNVVLFFYPKDGSPGCTAEACSFRDNYSAFVDKETVVVGISPDSNDSHKAFALKHNIEYPLISDADGSLRELFYISGDLWGLIPGRVTIVIDKNGIIRNIYRSALRPINHVNQALISIQNIQDIEP